MRKLTCAPCAYSVRLADGFISQTSTSVSAMPEFIRLGDRFRTIRDATFVATFVQYAPAHTVGAPVQVPAGTVIVALDQVPGATGFLAYPEAYDELEPVLVPESERSGSGYAGRYAISLLVADIGGLLERVEPLKPRPTENRIPRVSRCS